MRMYSKIVTLSVAFCTLIAGMQPAKTAQDLLVGAAGAGNQKGLNYHLITQKMSPNTKNSSGQSALGMAAGNGQVEAVKFLLAQGANPNLQDNGGLTPLAWATFALNQQKTEKDYIDVINALLQAGARIDIFDNNGLSILHGAARSGNTGIIKLLLDRGARPLVNHEGSAEKGRTPIAEALRASRAAIIHVDLENQDIVSQAAFAQALEEAIAQLKKKEARKLFTAEIIEVINLLKAYGAKTNTLDALGHSLDYYIDQVQLISEAERKQLLDALNIAPKPRPVTAQKSDLVHVIDGLENFKSLIQQIAPVLARKIQMLIWTIQAAQKEVNPGRQYDLLRIGMALIAKIKELLKDIVADKTLFADIEDTLNTARTVLRDNALVISGKAQLTRPQPPAPSKPAAAQPQPTRAIQAPPPSGTQPGATPQKPESGILIVNAINFSNQPTTLRITFEGGQVVTIPIKPTAQMQTYALTPINYNLARSYVATLTSGSDQKILEIPNDNTRIIEVFDVKADSLGSLGTVDQYKLATIIINAQGNISLVPYQVPVAAAPSAKPNAAPAPVQPPARTGTRVEKQKMEILLDSESLLITDLINYSDKPAYVRIKYPGRDLEWRVPGAPSKTAPATQEIMRAGYPNAPLLVESFNQSATFSIVPADARAGKPIQVKRQLNDPTKPITVWNMSDVRQSKIIIEPNGDIKLVPDKKVTIVDSQRK